ncbi:MAG: TrbI/VirB10 family protein [Pseudomonadota bacterium]
MNASEPLEIRGKPRPVKRFKRGLLMTIAGAAGALVFGAAAFALRAPHDAAQPHRELYNTRSKPMPDGLADLPASYEEVSRPKLGPPLPGDLGAAMLAKREPDSEPVNPFRYEPATRPAGRAAVSNTPGARTSPLFFMDYSKQHSSSAASVDPQHLHYRSADPLAALAAFQPSAALAGEASPLDPNRQHRKEDFLSADTDPAIYNPHSLQTPASPYQIMAGTIIPASLVTGLNSDLPGQVIAQVTENVYDTATGRYLLIPQGARLIGRYDSVVAYGQSRALVVWTRIILPDASSLVIENLPAVDLSGYAGLEDDVDFHTWKLFQAAFLSSVLSVSSEIGRDSDDDDVLDALRDGGQRTINQAGQEVVSRQLTVQPTIRVRPGWRLRVIVNKDLVLRPFGG